MKVYHYLFLLSFFLPALLGAQEAVSMTYTMKLTRVYCDIPIDQDDHGPDPRFLIKARLQGMGSNISNITLVKLDDIETTGWIDIDDRIIVTGSLVPGQRTINLCNTGINVIFDDLDAWEEDNGGDNTLDPGDEFALELSTRDPSTQRVSVTGRPETNDGPDPRFFIIDGARIDPDSPFKFEISVEYHLENALRRVAITGDVNGNPVADICQGGAAYIQAILDNNFSGGYIDYERSLDSGLSWTFLGRKSINESLRINLRSTPGEKYRARLALCLESVDSTVVNFSNLDVMPSILSNDIDVYFDAPCPGEATGTITLESIANLRPGDSIRVQLLKQQASSGTVVPNTTIDNPTLPYEFIGVERGYYYVIVTRLTRNEDGDELPACSVNSRQLYVNTAQAPLVWSYGTSDASCDRTTGSVFAAGRNDFQNQVDITLFAENDPNTPLMGPVTKESDATHEFTGLLPGNYFFTVDDGEGCPTRSVTLTIRPVNNRASGSFTPNGAGLVVDCQDQTILMSFSPDAGTGNNRVSLKGIGMLLNGDDSQIFRQDIDPGSSYSAPLGLGNYEVTFFRRGQPFCERTYTFSITTPNPPIDITVIDEVAPTDCDPTSGAATVDVSGGAPGYTPTIAGVGGPTSNTPQPNGSIRYEFTGLAGGNYSLQVTDASGCRATTPLIIPIPATVTVAADAATSKLVLDCKGDTDGRIQLVGTGVGPLSYRFTPPGATPGSFGTQTLFENLLPGTYLAEVEDQTGCRASQSIEIIEPEELEIFEVSYTTRYECGQPLVDFRIRFSGVPDISYCLGDAAACEFRIILRGGDPEQAVPLGSPLATVLTGPSTLVQELLLRNQVPGDYDFQLSTVRFNPSRITCPSNVVSVAAIPPPPLFVEIVDKTDPPCFGDSGGTITVRYGGGDPNETFNLAVYANTEPTEATFPPIIKLRNNLPYSLDTTLTIDRLPDPQNSRAGASSAAVPSDLYYFARITPTTFYSNGTDCTVQSHPDNPPPGELVQLASPDPMSFEANFTKGLECDGTGAILTVSEMTGGTPPYRFSIQIPSEPFNEVIYDFLPQTSFEISTRENFSVYMMDANGCQHFLGQSKFPDYEPTRDYGLNFAQTQLSAGECPPDPSDPLTGRLQLTGGLGENTYTFSTLTPGGNVVNLPSPITTADSVILLQDLVPGTVTVQLENSSTGQQCQTFTFEVEALPSPLEAVVELNQGESCLGAADGQVSLRVTGGVEPITFIYLGVETQIPAGQPAVFTIQNVGSGSLQVGIEDANDCYFEESVDITPSQGGMTVEVTTTTDETPCQGAGNASITLNLNGGTGPYQFDWLDDADAPFSVAQNGMVIRGQLTRQEYEYRIVDINGCVREGSAWPGGRDPLIAQIVDIVQPGCLDPGSFRVEIVKNSFPASASFSVSLNGAPPQNELNFTGLDEGSYSIQVLDDAGCSQAEPLVVELIRSGSDFTATIVPSPPSCNDNDGQLLITPDGGQAPYTYAWADFPAINGPSLTGLAPGDYAVTITDANGCTFSGIFTVDSSTGPSGITATTNTGTTCGEDNGTLTVSPTGGAAPLTYSWADFPAINAPGLTDLAAGDYVLTITDANGCTATETFNIAASGAPRVVTLASSTPETCGMVNGSATLSISGFAGAVTYAWSHDGSLNGPMATGLSAGSYSVTVTDAAGCSQTLNYSISPSPGITGVDQINVQNTTCNEANGAISFNTQGGTPPYSYVWSHDQVLNAPLATSLAPGTYTVDITDAIGCTFRPAAFTVGGSQGSSIVLLSDTPADCGQTNGDIFIFVSPTGPTYTYTWSHDAALNAPLAMNLAAGTYTVTATGDNGCSAEFTHVLASQGSLTVEATATNSECTDGLGTIGVTVITGLPPYSYNWGHAPGQDVAGFTNVNAGSYAVTVTDNSGCTGVASAVVELIEPPTFNVTSQVNTTCGEDNGSLTILATGPAPYTYEWADFPAGTEETVTDLGSGNYALTITNGTGCSVSGSFDILPSDPAALSVVNQVNSTGGMSNGSITLAATGFPGGVTYTWSHDSGLTGPMANNLPPGQYTISGTDGSCTDEILVTVTGPNPIAAEIIDLRDAICTDDNGTATVSVTTGVAPYSYAWSHAPGQDVDSFTDLSAGDYTVTVSDAAGVTLELNFSIGFTAAGPTAITSTALTHTICGLDNGELEVVPTGGTAPFTYAWADFPAINAPGLTDLAAGDYALTITDANGCTATETFTIDGSDLPVVSLDVSTNPDPGLDNGSISVTTSGMALPLTYVWSHDATLNAPLAEDLANGSYTVTVTGANGCSDDLTVVLNGPDPIVAEIIDLRDAICTDDNGTATVSVTTGVAPYAYAWSHAPGQDVDSFTDLSAGDYTVTVSDAAGVTLELDFSIGFIAGPTAITSTVLTNTSCGLDNGELEVVPTGGTAPFTYAWADFPAINAPGLTDLAAGDYALTITDANGCTATETFTIDGSDLPVVSLDVSTNPDPGLDNGSISVTTSGMALPLTYVWSHDATLNAPLAEDLANGSYTVTVTGANGCSDDLTVVLNGPDPIVAEIIDLRDAICTDDNGTATVSVTTGVAPYSYAWSHAPGQDVDSFTDLSAGDYTVTVSDAAGVTLELNFSIGFIAGPTAITSTVLTNTSCGLDNGELEVVPAGGTEPFTYAWADFPAINAPGLTDLAAGDYALTITDANGCTATETFTIDGSDLPLVSLDVSTDPDPGLDNGSISVTTSGMVLPLTYVWSHDATLNAPLAGNLANGSYTVTVTGANGCSDDLTVVLNGPDPIIAEIIDLRDAICTDDNGTATVSVTTGVAPYSYAWSHAPGQDVDSFTDLSAGAYTVTVSDAAGVTLELNFSIGFIAGPTAITSTVLTNTSCGLDNGELEVVPAGGTEPFTYAWADFPAINAPGLTDLAAGDYALTITDANGCTATETFTIDGSDLPLVSLDVSTDPDPGLDNGSISVTTSGMVLPLTYVWSHDATLNAPLAGNLANGSYTVTVTGANGCSDDLTVVLNGPDPIIAEIIDLRDAICTDDNGTATVSVTTGVAPYSYAWSHAPGQDVDSFTDLSAGDYTVTVSDAAGVTLELNFSIGFIAGPTAITSTVLTNTSCGLDNGELEVVPTGGTEPFTYAWADFPAINAPGLTDLAAGDYALTITDANGCTATETFTVDDSDLPVVSLDVSTDPDPGLDNGSISVTTSGMALPLTYVWSHDATLNAPLAEDLANGSYTVTVTGANGCSDDLTVVLNGPDPIIAEIIDLRDALCTDDNGTATVSVTTGVAPYSYAWSHAPGQDVDSFTDLSAGAYTVTVSDAAGVTLELNFSIGFIAGPTAIEATTQLSTFCDLDNGILNVSPQGGNGPYTYAWSHDADLTASEALDLVAGEYSVTATDANGCTISETFTVESSEAPTVTVANQSDPTCGEDNGSIQLAFTVLSSPVTASWSHDPLLTSLAATNLAPGTYDIIVTGSLGCTATVSVSLAPQVGLTATVINVNDAICDNRNGTATIEIITGTAPYTYNWSHAPGEDQVGFDDLAAGDYSVTITDANGCFEVRTFSIGFVEGPTVITVVSQLATICGFNNGILQVAPVGGTAPYTYAWSHDADLELSEALDLPAGDYSVTITDANDCAISGTYNIGESETPTAEVVEQRNASCGQANGFIRVEAANLSAPLTYEWSHNDNLNEPVAENLTSGNYSVTITGALGCSAEAQASVSSLDGPTISLLSVENSTCTAPNGSITISYDGGGQTPFTYTWSHDDELNDPTADNLPAGDYGVTITDVTGCSNALQVSVTAQVTALLPNLTVAPATCAQNDGTTSVTLSGGSEPFTYTWSHDATLTGPTATNLPEGEHSVTITDANGCAETETFTILTTEGPSDITVVLQLATICGFDNGILRVAPVGGTAPYTYAWSHDADLELSEALDLPAGDYSVTITDANSCTISGTYNIGESATPTAEVVEQGDASCGQANGFIRVGTANLSAPLAYEWSHDNTLNEPFAENLIGGNYSVTITGGLGCSAEIQASVSSLDGPAISLLSVENSTCTAADGSISISYDGGGQAPFTYTWSHDAELNDPQADNLVAGNYSVTITDATDCKDVVQATVTAEVTELLPNLSVAPATCAQNDGTATVVLSGGTAPFTFEWSHDASLTGSTATNLPEGEHSVTITDANGCAETETFTILTTEGPSDITVVLQLATICGFDNGILRVAPVGGTAPYTYAWSHDATLTVSEAVNLPAGDYSVTITDANSCTISGTYNIGESATPTAEVVEQGDASCGQANGFIRVGTANLSAPLAYEWSHDENLNGPLAENLISGEYSLTITGGLGCSAEIQASVSSLDGPAISLLSVENSTCTAADGSISISYDGGGQAPFTYTWSHDAELNDPQADNLVAGNYSVTITDATDCKDVVQATVTAEVTELLPNLSVAPATCAQNDGTATVVLSGGTAPFTYEWSHDVSLTGSTVTNLPEGEHSVTITDANGCAETETFTILTTEGPSGITAVLQLATICGFDNGILRVAPPVGGTPPYTYAWSHDANLTVSEAVNLPAGDYSVTITDANSCTISETYNIGESATPTAEVVEQGDASCGQANGFIRVGTANLSAPLAYEWSHDENLNGPLAENLISGEYSLTITGGLGCSAEIQASVSSLDGPSISVLSVANSTCTAADGSISISYDGGGQAPFTYTWSHDAELNDPQADNLVAGNYRVTITDATDCKDVVQATVTAEVTELLPNLSVAPATCAQNDGTATVVLSGGTAPFTFEWSHDASLTGSTVTNLPEGEHSVTITDANGCAETETFTILTTEGPSGITAVLQLATICGFDNGILRVAPPVGGTPPYTYAWSHDANLTVNEAVNLPAGDYSVTITDANSCTISETYNIGESETPTAEVVEQGDASCGQANGFIRVGTANLSAPLTYEWNHDNTLNEPFAENLIGGNYSVTITGGLGCSAEIQASVSSLDGPAISLLSVANSTCTAADGSISISYDGGGQAPLTYTWSHDAELNDPQADNLVAGNYSVTITDATDCKDVVQATVTAEVTELLPNLSVAPATCAQNDGTATVVLSGGTAPFTYEWSHDASLTGSTVTNLPEGEHSVTITDANGCAETETFGIVTTEGPGEITVVTQLATICGFDNGILRVAPVGGTAPYTYAWSHDATLTVSEALDLPAGDYSVTITDANSCTISETYNIGESTTPTAEVIEQGDASCGQANGFIRVGTANLSAPLAYEWNHDENLNGPLAENLISGDYSVTITGSQGCSATTDANINSSQSLTATVINQASSICEEGNGTATIEVTGGELPIAYAWSHAPGQDQAEFTNLESGDYTVTITDASGCTNTESFSIALVPGPTAVAVLQQEATSCGLNNGLVVVAPEGGTEPYTFAWDHDAGLNTGEATDLAAGDYTVTITDTNGCFLARTLTIDASDASTLMASELTAPTCGETNGAITLTTTGLTEPLTYAWEHDPGLNGPTATGLAQGDYGVTVTGANGCTASGTFSIIEGDAPTVSVVSQTDATCGAANGDITVTTTGLTEPLTYAWEHDPGLNSPTATGLAPGDYNVTVTGSSGCSANLQATIREAASPAISLGAVENALCDSPSGSISVSYDGGGTAPLIYRWSHDLDLDSPVAENLLAGSYQVTITDVNGCTDVVSAEVGMDNVPLLPVLSPAPAGCAQNDGRMLITLSGGTAPYAFSWSHDAVLAGPEATNLPAGDHTVTVTDANGCQEVIPFTTQEATGPESLEARTTVAATCGDNNGILVLQTTGGTGPYTYQWADLPSLSAGFATNLAAGDYAVTVTDDNGCTLSDVFTVGGSDPLAITLLDSTLTSCAELEDGSLTIEVTGGAAPYAISWSNGDAGPTASNLAGESVYTATITDQEGCTAEAAFSLTSPTPLTIALPTDTTLCQDDILVLDLTAYTSVLVTSPNGFSSTDPVVLIDEPGTYSVTVTEQNACAVSADVIVNFTGQTFVAGMVLPSDVIVGDSVVILETSWPAPENVTWVFDRTGARQVDQQQNQYWFVFDESGEYNLSLLASFGGCEDLLTKHLTVHPDSTTIPSVGLVRTGIADVIISPNPNDGNFTATVELTNPDRIFMNLYQMDGTPVDRQEDQGNSDYTFNYNLGLNAGTYLLLVQTPTARRTVVIIVSD